MKGKNPIDPAPNAEGRAVQLKKDRTHSGIRLIPLLLMALVLAAAGLFGGAPAYAQTVTNICDRTPEVEQAILDELTGSPTCSTVTDTQLSGITNLRVTDYSNATIVPSDFAGLTMLESLYIVDSPALTETPADAFAEVSSSVTTLFVWGTGVTTFHEDTFNGLSAVRELGLGANRLTSLDPDLFDGMTSLDRVSLVENYIGNLETGMFADSPNIRIVYLNHNLITEIGENTFSGLSNLEELNVFNNRITSVHKDAFQGLTSLRKLDFYGNSISTIHEDTFDGLSSLRQLNFDQNNVSSLHRGTFDGLASLWELRFNSNNISSLHRDTFDGLTALAHLQLADNDLSTLPSDIFEGLTNLNLLYIHRNKLASIHRDTFDGLTALNILAMSYNELQTLPTGLFTDPTSLSYLYLNNNNISSLDEDIFSALTSLNTLALKSNSLSALDEDIFDDVTNLGVLTLYDNELTSLDEDLFDGLSNLQRLELNDNGLTSLDEDLFDGLSSLGVLTLYDNQLTSLDEDLFDGLSSLQRLELNDNGLASPDSDLFDGLVQLSTLDLSGNSMTTLTTGLFDELDDSLRTLRLQSNNLTGLTASIFTGLTGMQELDLSCNQIATLNLNEFDPFDTSLTYLDISGNSFTTPPTETALRNKLTNTNLKLYTGTNTVCQPPTDVGLSDVRLSNGVISPAFQPPGVNDTYGTVAHDVTTTTITITSNDPDATVGERTGNKNSIYDDDPMTPGWQVKLPTRRNVFNFTVRSKNGLQTKNYTLQVFRAPPVPITFSRAALTIDEGASDAYTVVLDTEPTGPVTISIAAGGDVTTQPNTLSFTTSNWDTRRTVTVNASEDNDATDDAVTITHTVASGSAAEYAVLSYLPSVQVTVRDDDIEPPPVRGFSAIDESQDAIALGWWSERNAAEYELEYRKQGYDTGDWTRVTRGDFDHTPSTSSNRSLTGIATGLECNTTYDFRIRLRGAGDRILDTFGPHAEDSHKTGQCALPDRPTNLMYTLQPDCATLTWTAPTEGDYTGVRIRRLSRGEENWTLIHERLNSRPTSYRDCTTTGDGYGEGDNPRYAYRVTYVKFESGLLVESKHAKSGLHQHGPAFQDHHHADPRNVRLTRDTDSQRRMTWEAPPSWSLTTWAGLQGASVPVDDPWITGYLVERREFNVRADGYLYFTDEKEDVSVWSATMTVAENSSDTSRGYKGGSSDTYGSLSQDRFNHFSGRYRVYEISYGLGRLQLTLDGIPPTHATDDWDLVIDGTRFSLADATISESDLRLALISWNTSSISWTSSQQVSVQLVDRDRYGWKTVRAGGDGDTSTSFTDNERANGRKFVYRVRTTNRYGASTTHSIFDWLWDSPYRDAVIDLAATDTTEDNASGSTGDGSANSPASGAPTIDGTPRVGETLTASTSAVSDEDGLTQVSYRYQWNRNNAGISGATGSSYTLTGSDQGATITVQVTFTDDEGNAESLTSAATGAVSPPAPLTATLPVSPYQSARHKGADDRPQVIAAFSLPVASFDKTTPSVSLTGAAVSSVQQHEEDGLKNAWMFFLNPDGADDIVFSLATDQPCDSGGICAEDGTMLSQGVQVTLPGPDDTNSPATGLPTISGTPQVGETLTADTSPIDDADGLTNVSYGYQWIAGTSDIGGATGSSHELTSSQQGQTIQVRVTFEDDAGNSESLTSVATETVAAAPAPLTAAFQDLPDSHDGSATFTFQVLFSEDVGITYVNMRDDAFTVDEGDVTGARRVDGRNDLWEITVEPDGDDGVAVTLTGNRACTTPGAVCTKEDTPRQLTNSPTATIMGPAEAPPTNRSAAGVPTISGTPQVDQTLTADTSAITDEDGLENVSYSYQWLAGGSDISGATRSSYTLTASEQGETIQVKVSFTDDGDNGETLTSEATVAVAAAPNRDATGAPTISGTPQVDETLTADTTGISDEDGLTNVSYGYQWIAGGTDIAGATGASFTLTASEQGETMQVRVSFEDDAGNSESLTSVATEAVAPKPVPLTATFSNVPTSHDGSSEFTFTLSFSENVRAGYARIRDHAFTIDEGDINKAQRVTQGSNQSWTITVEPDGNEDIVITLPSTTDCSSQRGICTYDDRMLSHSTTITIAGPGQ